MPGFVPLQEPARRVAHACFTVSACGREVTVSDAPAGTSLPALRRVLRSRVDGAAAWPEASDAFTDALCRVWPSNFMTIMARRQPESQIRVVASIPVITAKLREEVEYHWGDSATLRESFDAIGMELVVEFANLWFTSIAHRDALREACREARAA